MMKLNLPLKVGVPPRGCFRLIKIKMEKVKDKCVSCEVETSYNKTDHIDFRLGYIEGAGQLCLECYEKIYGLTPKFRKKTRNR